MTFKLADNVVEASNTVGTGAFALTGAVNGYQEFSDFLSNGDTTWYAARMGIHWETGIGTYSSSGNSLTRTTVLGSSNGGAAVSFPIGTKTVVCTQPAAGAGIWVPIIGWTAISGSPSAIDIPLVAAMGFTKYELNLDGIRPATDDSRLSLRVSISGVIQTSGYGYNGRFQGFNAGGDAGSTADSITTSIGLTRVSGSSIGVGNATGETYSGKISFSPFDTGQRRRFQHAGCYTLPDGGTEIDFRGSGAYGSTLAIDGVRLLFATNAAASTFGNFANIGRYCLKATKD